jgi:hypothetical protein
MSINVICGVSPSRSWCHGALLICICSPLTTCWSSRAGARPFSKGISSRTFWKSSSSNISDHALYAADAIGCAKRSPESLLPSLISPLFHFSRLFVIHGELTRPRTARPVLPYGLTTSIVGGMQYGSFGNTSGRPNTSYVPLTLVAIMLYRLGDVV